MSEVVVDINELDYLLTHVKNRGTRLRDDFESLKYAFGQVVASDALSGEIKNAIDLGMENQHIPMTKAFIEIYHVIEDEIADMIREVQNYLEEQSPLAIISESALDEAKGKFQNNIDEKVRRENRFDNIYRNVEDLIELNRPTAIRASFTSEHENLMSDAESLKTRLHDFSYTAIELEEMIHEIEQKLTLLESMVDREFDDSDRLSYKQNGAFRERMFERSELRTERLAAHADFMENFRGAITEYGIRFGLMSEYELNSIWNQWAAARGTARNSFEGFLDTLSEPQRSQFLWLKGFTTSLAAIAGDPVNMSTGNFLYDHEDIRIDGAYPLVFRRFYNSVDSHERDLGKNWCHNYQIDLTETKDGRVAVMYEDGHLEFYTPAADGVYVAQTGIFTRLIKHLGDEAAVNEIDKLERYELMFLDGRVYHFNAFGLLIKQVDSHKNETVLTYEGIKLVKVETPSGHLSFSHTADGYIESVVDHSGRKMTYEYDQNKLVSFKDVNENVMKHLYDSKGRLMKVINREGRILFDQVYDGKDRASKQKFVDGGSMVYDYDEDKKETIFTWQNGTKMTYKHNENYLTTGIVYPDGEEKIEFNDLNQRTCFTDKLGNTTRFEYDEWGNINKVTNALGVVTEIEYKENTDKMTSMRVAGKKKSVMVYDKTNKISYSEDALGNKTTFTYNEQGLPTTIAQPDGSKIRSVYDERGNITQLTNATGVVSSYEYDSLNRVVATIDGNKQRTEFSYDSLDNMVQVKNADGYVQEFEYNNNSKITKITDFNGATTKHEYNELGKVSKVIDPLGRETSLAYDSLWNVSELVQPNGAKTQFRYNALNRLERIVNPEGHAIQYEYDAVGNRTKIIDEEGNTTHLSYDALGQLISAVDVDGNETSYEYDDEGRLVAAIDAMNHRINLEYDVLGRLVKEIDVLGATRVYTYTSIGKVASRTDEIGRTTAYEYAIGGVLNSIHHPDGTQEVYDYDANGNIVKHTSPTGVETSYTYDSLNRVIKITSEGEKHFAYDAVGNVISMIDELGNATTYTYTLTGKLETVTDALGHVTTYTHDSLDQLIEVCQGDERITRYERDLLGKVIGMTDPLGQIEKYTYDVRGQLIEKLDKEGYLTSYGYTKRGDISHIQYADGKEVEMSYNALHQLTEVQDWLGTTQIKVDALGRATQVADHNGKIVEYQYGNTGQRTGITYPDGKQVAYTYDPLDRLQGVTDGATHTTYSYDEVGRLSEKVFSSGEKTEYTYNSFGHLTSLTHFRAGNVLDNFVYEYDLAWNTKSMRKERQNLANESGVFEYNYDPLNRLSEVVKDGETLRSYSYDAFGNRERLVENGATMSYTYNVLNQLVSSADSDSIVRYSYDKRGNMKQMMENDILVAEYEFNPLNRLEKVANYESGLSAMYRYNGLGHRVGQVAEHPTQQIDDVLDLTRNYHNLLMRGAEHFVWDSGLLSSSGTSYLLDELGSPVRFGDEVYTFDEFGVPIHDVLVTSQPFGFTGYQFDPVANTHFAQARQYDPMTGRFMSQDKMPGIIEMPFTFNPYLYCWNQPMNLVDLNGLWPQWMRDVGNFVVDVGAVVVGTVGTVSAVSGAITMGAIGGVAGFVSGGVHGLFNGDGFIDGAIGGSATGAMAGIAIGTAPGFALVGVAGQRFYNDCQETALNSSFIGNYRGQVIIRIPGDGGMAAGPIMFLGSDVGYTDGGRDLLQHENGHFREYQILGALAYFLGIGLPSFRNSRNSDLRVDENGVRMRYNNQPWEITAEIFGGVERRRPDGSRYHTDEAILAGAEYFAFLYFNRGLSGFGNIFSNAWDFSGHDFSALNKEGE